MVATGSAPFFPPPFDALAGTFLDSDRALSLDRVPASIAVVGGGIVGLAFAYEGFRRGRTVALFERSARGVEITPAGEQYLFDGDLFDQNHDFVAEQVRVNPPTILLHVNDPELAHFTYRRYLENSVRHEYPFTGTPVRLSFRKKS